MKSFFGFVLFSFFIIIIWIRHAMLWVWCVGMKLKTQHTYVTSDCMRVVLVSCVCGPRPHLFCWSLCMSLSFLISNLAAYLNKKLSILMPSLCMSEVRFELASSVKTQIFYARDSMPVNQEIVSLNKKTVLYLYFST